MSSMAEVSVVASAVELVEVSVVALVVVLAEVSVVVLVVSILPQSHQAYTHIPEVSCQHVVSCSIVLQSIIRKHLTYFVI